MCKLCEQRNWGNNGFDIEVLGLLLFIFVYAVYERLKTIFASLLTYIEGEVLRKEFHCAQAAKCLYSCNEITTTQIQISRQNLRGFFSKYYP